MFIVCAALLLPAAASSQAAEVRLDRARAAVAEAGVPLELLESKVAEGRAKGVPMERIAVAVEQRASALVRGHAALLRAGAEAVAPADMGMAADALQAGVPEAALERIASTASGDRRLVALAALGQLVGAGILPERALARVERALARGPEAMARLPAQAQAAQAGRGGPPAGVPAAGKPAGAGKPKGVGKPGGGPPGGGPPGGGPPGGGPPGIP